MKDGSVPCHICQRRCLIRPAGKGYCRTRQNLSGRLESLIYSKVSTWAISPIEKKPLFHYYPGSMWLSLGTFGCNFRCPGCQNWDIAHYGSRKARQAGFQLMDLEDAQTISPQKAVEMASKYRCKGVSWTYNEPTIWFEYTLDTARLAREKGLLTNYVTNGFITREALDTIGPYLDSFRVDLKAFSNKVYKAMCNIQDFKGILEVTRRAKYKWKMHIEIVTNVTPGYNDNDKELTSIARWICKELGPETPWHVTQFIPHLWLGEISQTPVRTLEEAREIGFNQGLHYVYIGNVPGHRGEDTYCFNCKKLLIKRSAFSILEYNIKDSSCPFCGEKIPGRF